MSEQARLLVSGASGKLGRRTAELLLERVEPDDLILVTRTPDAVADLAARGCEVRRGDHAEPESIRDAYAGADRLLLVSASDLEVRADQHRAAVAAAASCGVRRVVYTSGLASEPPNPAAVAPSHHATEQALAASGLAWTVLRNSLYADYQVPEAARALAAGRLTHNRGGGAVAYVAREDCAAVAAAVLAGQGHEGRVYEVTGPEALDASALARLYTAVGGAPVEVEELDDDAFAARLQGDAGDDEHARYGAQLVTSFGRAIREGWMSACTDTVERLTGRPPQTLRHVLEAGLRA